MTRPSPPQLHLQTTAQILKATTNTIFFSGKHYLISFLILSFVRFIIQYNTHASTHEFTSYFDKTPSIKTILTNHTSPITTKTLDEFNQDTLLKTHFNATLFLLDSFDHHVGPTFTKFPENVGSSSSGTNDSHDMDDIMLGLIRAFWGPYWIIVFGFVAASVWVHGGVFFLVVNDKLKTRKSLYTTSVDGTYLGATRLVVFVRVRLMVRDALIHLLGVIFFQGVKDKFMLINIYLWTRFLPFSVVSPWVKGYEYEFWWILFLWDVLDWLLSFVFDVGAWVVMVDPRKRHREVFSEGCHLFSLMFYQAITLKSLEFFICRLFARTVLKLASGKNVALAIQSFMEVYFMVAWLMFYFSAKYVDANSKGIPFGRRELEAMVKD